MRNLPSTPTPSLLELLRQETYAAHGAMHEHPLLKRLLKSPVSLHSYQALLLAYRDIYGNLEPLIIQQLNSGELNFCYQDRLKTPWLIQDLNYWNVNSPSTEKRLPVCDLVKRDVGALIGILYVVEGSTLGARMINEKFLRESHISASAGGRFFHGYGENTPAMWNAFVTFVQETQNICASRASAAALATFDYFRQALDRHVISDDEQSS